MSKILETIFINGEILNPVSLKKVDWKMSANAVWSNDF